MIWRERERDKNWTQAGRFWQGAYCLKGGERESGTGMVYDGRGGLAGKKGKSTATSVLGGGVLYCIVLICPGLLFLPFPFRSTVSEWGGGEYTGRRGKGERFKLNLDIA